MRDSKSPLIYLYDYVSPLLQGILEGGVVLKTISRQSTPSVFDVNKELLPCTLLRVISEIPFAPPAYSSLNFSFFLYQNNETDLIEIARNAIYERLHKQYPFGYPVYHSSDTNNLYDDVLRANLIISRYQLLYLRRPFNA